MSSASELPLPLSLPADTVATGSSETARPLSTAEGELLDGIRAGSHAAFEVLVTAHQKPLYNLLLRVLGNPDDAADVLQETFLSAYRGAGSFRGDCDIRTWLYRIAIRRAANHRRWWRARRQTATVSLDAETEASTPSLSETLVAPMPTRNSRPCGGSVRRRCWRRWPGSSLTSGWRWSCGTSVA
ncbi:RNA polymerase sigma factor [Chloracidobacterium thermophilum]|uniref:RNA polymerase sigma factor n=1 Tax=Chloracidobacterium thermophilum TaxID=458033 RepID=UPI001BB2EA65|nr:sigma-70 family RNA polymerase sigma factor [Chloracidobacterium thermophilum]QUV78184.1 sigma-70 family RNA polymerase sigma factor [Chloracidobacterium thermophilum]